MKRLIADKQITKDMIKELAELNLNNIERRFEDREEVISFLEKSNKYFNEILNNMDKMKQLIDDNKENIKHLQEFDIYVPEDKYDISKIIETEDYDYYKNNFQYEYEKTYEEIIEDRQSKLDDLYYDIETDLMFDDNLNETDGNIDRYNEIKTKLKNGEILY